MNKKQCDYCPSKVELIDLKKHVDFYHTRQVVKITRYSNVAVSVGFTVLGFIVGALVVVFI